MTKHLLLTAFLATALGLKMNNPDKEQVLKPEAESIQPMLEEVSVVEGKSVVQNLRSDGGMSYYGALFVGGQEQVSIYDTGSFEVVILSKCVSHDSAVSACCPAHKCPFAQYNTDLSGSNFEAGAAGLAQITYGSGPVLVKAGSDHMQLSDETRGKTTGNTIAQAKVPVQIIVDHDIALFKVTPMTAIVGVGPGLFAERKQRMVNQMGIKRFMVCFQENQNENGLWTWNDRDRSTDLNWMVVPSPADEFWAAPVSNFRLDDSTVGCMAHSCGGLIDTGTSLNTFPTSIVNGIIQKINDGFITDCSDLSKFPDFVFDMGGHTLRLPPSSYIGDAGEMYPGFHKQLAFAPLPMSARDLAIVKSAERDGRPAPKVHSCVLMVSSEDNGDVQLSTSGGQSEQAQFGDMVILGMSLFRKYAVQFDLSGDLENQEGTRAMRFAEATSDCSGTVTGESLEGFSRKAKTLHKVDLDKLRISPLQRRLAPHSAVMGNQFFRKGVLRI